MTPKGQIVELDKTATTVSKHFAQACSSAATAIAKTSDKHSVIFVNENKNENGEKSRK